ncbi:hypothetical protein FI667_g9840, partial [Globisporangium splendens]
MRASLTGHFAGCSIFTQITRYHPSELEDLIDWKDEQRWKVLKGGSINTANAASPSTSTTECGPDMSEDEQECIDNHDLKDREDHETMD